MFRENVVSIQDTCPLPTPLHMRILFVLALLLAGFPWQTAAQFMTRDQYLKAQREKELGGRMNALAVRAGIWFMPCGVI